MPAGHRRWTTVARNLRAQRIPDCWLHAYGKCKFDGAPIDYSAGHLHPMAFSADHATPTNKGGLDVAGNARPSHRSCNCARHDDDLPTHELRITRRW